MVTNCVWSCLILSVCISSHAIAFKIILLFLLTSEHGASGENVDGPDGCLVFAQRHHAFLLQPHFGRFIPRAAEKRAEFSREQGAHRVGVTLQLGIRKNEDEQARMSQ